MTPEKDRRFLPVTDRADMRVILAATLGGFGVDKKLIDTMDGVVREAAGDVLISDDADEYVMFRLAETGADDQPICMLVQQSGFTRLPIGRTQY